MHCWDAPLMRPRKLYWDGWGLFHLGFYEFVLLFFVVMIGMKKRRGKSCGCSYFQQRSIVVEKCSEVVCIRNMLEIPWSTPPWHVYIRLSTPMSSSLFKMCKGLKHMRQMTVGACPPEDGRSGSQILACSNLALWIWVCKGAWNLFPRQDDTDSRITSEVYHKYHTFKPSLIVCLSVGIETSNYNVEIQKWHVSNPYTCSWKLDGLVWQNVNTYLTWRVDYKRYVPNIYIAPSNGFWAYVIFMYEWHGKKKWSTM